MRRTGPALAERDQHEANMTHEMAGYLFAVALVVIVAIVEKLRKKQ